MFKTIFGLLKDAFKGGHKPQFHNKGKYSERPARNFRMEGGQNRAGSKIRRAIRRGNFGVVNKHGVIGAAIAETEREKWLFEHSKPHIKLSTQA